jgi:ribosomal protein S18 acetylase RimI-like enzyme
VGRLDDAFWAQFLGIDSDEWNLPGISYRVHVGLSGYQGFWCFRRNDRVVVSAPSRWLERLEVLLSGWDQDRLMTCEALAEALGADFERAIGPAFQGCLEPSRFAHRADARVRKLSLADQSLIDRFRIECRTDAWDSSGLAKAELWRYACFQGDRIMAMAGYRRWRGQAGDPCVLTHPDFRGQRCGAAVTAAVVADALANEELLLYQTLESNQAAVRLALALGYERYGNHVAVRLKRDSPEPCCR